MDTPANTPAPLTVEDFDGDTAVVDTYRTALNNTVLVRIEVRQHDKDDEGNDEVATVVYDDEQVTALIDALIAAREHARQQNT